MSESVNIYAESTPNPNVCKFVVNKMILPNNSLDYRTKEQAKESMFATELFGNKDVEGVFIMNNFVSITKSNNAEWDILIPVFKEKVIDLITNNTELVKARKKANAEDEGEIITKIRQLLDEHVKPAVEMDGGAIDFKSFEDGVVTVQMKGACSGCPSSTITLKSGIEGLLKRMIPEVESVEAEMV